MIRSVPQRSRFRLSILILAVLVVAVVGSIAFLGWRQSIPRVRVASPLPSLLGHATPVTVTLEAARGRVARAEVRLVQGGPPVVVATGEGGPGQRAEISATVEPARLGLREGPATLEVWARDDVWRPLRLDDRPVATQPVTIDLTPPRIDIVAATQYVGQGGAGVVVFRVSGASRSEVRTGEAVTPSFAAGTPEQGLRVALVGLPHDFPSGAPIAITALDEAGNAAARTVPFEVKPRRFPRDTITITDHALQAKVPELLPQRPPSQPLLEGFLTINRDQRRQAEQEKRRVGSRTAESALWQGPFVQPRNTQVFSNFAETRAYVHGGREVDTQIHFGFDLASTKQSAVPAANRGVVVFAGPLSIYGNTVILDHGLGLQTLYAHLSTIAVKPGDAVDKAQELGRTGTTGLALGDHLHYEVLVHGVSVTPIEWWDARWIRDHVNTPLVAAGLPPVPGLEAPAARENGERRPAPGRRPRSRR
jgi:murein DD-endopeptidase MepM/ murein hydrolase activator NlpD